MSCLLCQYVGENFHLVVYKVCLYGVIDFSNLKEITVADTRHADVAISRRLPLISTAYAVSRNEKDADHQRDLAQLKTLRPP